MSLPNELNNSETLQRYIDNIKIRLGLVLFIDLNIMYNTASCYYIATKTLKNLINSCVLRTCVCTHNDTVSSFLRVFLHFTSCSHSLLYVITMVLSETSEHVLSNILIRLTISRISTLVTNLIQSVLQIISNHVIPNGAWKTINVCQLFSHFDKYRMCGC